MSDRLRLWDRNWRLLWAADTSTEPAYRYVNTWVNATIDYDDGTRWVGQVYRCPEGLKRWSYEDLTKLTYWPNPVLEVVP